MIIQSRLTKILGCSEGWEANGWTVESLLERGVKEDWSWKANFVDESGLAQDITQQGLLRKSSELLNMMKRDNLTLRLFDAIGVHQINHDIRTKGGVDTDKRGLRRGYSMPEILQQDIFDTCQVMVTLCIVLPSNIAFAFV